MPILMRRRQKNMQHDHHNAIPSQEADQIEKEIETGLEQFQLILGEFRSRFKNIFHPEKVLLKRWVWVAVIIIFEWWSLNRFLNKKKLQKLRIKKRKL
jgi:hypothetical protein